MLPEITVLECLSLEVGWKHHVITAFLKEEHKEKEAAETKRAARKIRQRHCCQVHRCVEQ